MAKKTSKKSEMAKEDDNMQHNMMRYGKGSTLFGAAYLIIGIFLILAAYETNSALVTTLATFGVGIWFFIIGANKIGFNCWGMCGGCCCCSCEDDAGHKHM